MKLVKPKKFLGQHFLKDLKVAQDIADTVDTFPELPILEVGPGMGVLTQFLVKKDRLIKVVEVDYESVAYLREAYPSLEDHIIEDDFPYTQPEVPVLRLYESHHLHRLRQEESYLLH